MAIVIVRTRRPPDIYLEQIAELNNIEGFPVTAPTLLRRLETLPHDDRLLLAVDGESLLGYAHLHTSCDLVNEVSAEVALLIVRPDHRRHGIGRTLVAAAETWARQSDCARLLLRTDVVRTSAHAFFVALGYQEAATTLEFVRDLSRSRLSDAPTIPLAPDQAL